ncbi:MAG: hypothetical protein IKW80_00725, partial [Thermoguttaceae bacterium]|nr:hypothetical protein [Thermoguttaceae bacterium]
MLVFAFLTVAASVCQAQYDDLSEDTTVDNIDSFAQQHSMLNLNGFTLTLEVTDTQSITNFFLVKGAGDKTTNIVAKTGNGALTVPQNGNIIKFNPTVNDFIIKQGTLVLERDCIYAQNVKIEQGAALTLSNVQGGASVQNLTGTGTFNVNTLEDDAVGGILKNTADSVFNGIITGNGNLRLRGDGNINHTLTLTGANTNTGLISFDIDSNSTGVLNLTLQDAAIVATCPFNGQALPVTLTYDVTSGERSITITGDTYVKNLKTIAKTGD